MQLNKVVSFNIDGKDYEGMVLEVRESSLLLEVKFVGRMFVHRSRIGAVLADDDPRVEYYRRICPPATRVLSLRADTAALVAIGAIQFIPVPRFEYRGKVVIRCLKQCDRQFLTRLVGEDLVPASVFDWVRPMQVVASAVLSRNDEVVGAEAGESWMYTTQGEFSELEQAVYNRFGIQKPRVSKLDNVQPIQDGAILKVRQLEILETVLRVAV